MLEQDDLEALSKTIGVTAEKMRHIVNSFDNIQGSMDEYIPLSSRLAKEPDPDKRGGFVFVGNDTWFPKHLVSARKCQQRKMARVAESGVVWTR